jgi:hypothetical protein
MNIDAGIPSSSDQILAGAIRNMLSIFPKKLGEPKVDQKHGCRVRLQTQRKIRRFQVSVHDVLGMSVFETVDPKARFRGDKKEWKIVFMFKYGFLFKIFTWNLPGLIRFLMKIFYCFL